MKIIAWVLAVVATLALALATLGLLLPGIKEGFSFEEMPFIAAGAIVLAVVGVLWWYGAGRSLARAGVGLVILTPAFLASLLVIGQHAVARVEGLWLARSLAVTDYWETPIEWPGFDGPVGLKIEIEVSHDIAPDGFVYPPEIRMGPYIEVPLDDAFATLTSGAGYFKDRYLDRKAGHLTLLKVVLSRTWPPDDKQPRRLDGSGQSRFVFHLFPGTVALMDSPDRLCLDTVAPGLPVCLEGQPAETGCKRPGRSVEITPLYRDGGELSALWLFAGGSDMVADFSLPLTETLRRQSRLREAPEDWTAMQKRLEPEGLGHAGYGLCPPGPKSHTANRICYCR